MNQVPALVIIDAQQGLLEGEHAVPNSATVIKRLWTLLDKARTAGALVIHLQNDGEPGALDEPNTPGWSIHPRLSPTVEERVIRKTGDDGFGNPDLMDVFKRNGVKRIAVAGLLSEMCVSATVRGGLARGLEIVLIRDAHATYDVEDISARVVARVAEHALGDEVELGDIASVQFTQPTSN